MTLIALILVGSISQTQHRIVNAAESATQSATQSVPVKWLRPGAGMGDRTFEQYI